jgi:tetratricopeptide (TPR) repeat protein
VDAALAWARAKAGVLASGSGELDAIASGSLATNPAAAEQPLWFAARVEAARNANPEQRVRLLQDAIAIDPDQTAARQSLFVAALEAGRHQYALAVFEPWLSTGGADMGDSAMEAESYEPQDPEDVEDDFSEERYEYSSERYQADRFLSDSGLDRQQRAQMAVRLSTAYEKVGEFNRALGALRTAGFLETEVAARNQLEQRSRALKSEVARREQNARRRPKISGNLEQENVVRPRLARAVAGKGGQP